MLAFPWVKSTRETKRLKVFNKAESWADPVGAALRSFNNLALGVTVVAEKEEQNANVVLVLGESSSPGYEYRDSYGTMKVGPSKEFKADSIQGVAKTLKDADSKEIFFAAIFLPGTLKATNDQKEAVIVHELIHACGFEDHDHYGIMYPQMKEQDGKLIEHLHEKGEKPMPPIRVGSKTRCTVQLLWSGKACKKI